MSSRTLPLVPPDVEAALIAALDTALDADVSNLKPRASTTAYRHLVVRADPQNLATPLTQYVRLGLSAYVTTATGTEDLAAAVALATAATRHVLRSRAQLLVHSEPQSGPARVFDSVLEIEFAYSTLLLEVALTL